MLFKYEHGYYLRKKLICAYFVKYCLFCRKYIVRCLMVKSFTSVEHVTLRSEHINSI